MKRLSPTFCFGIALTFLACGDDDPEETSLLNKSYSAALTVGGESTTLYPLKVGGGFPDPNELQDPMHPACALQNEDGSKILTIGVPRTVATSTSPTYTDAEPASNLTYFTTAKGYTTGTWTIAVTKWEGVGKDAAGTFSGNLEHHDPNTGAVVDTIELKSGTFTCPIISIK